MTEPNARAELRQAHEDALRAADDCLDLTGSLAVRDDNVRRLRDAHKRMNAAATALATARLARGAAAQ